MKFINITDSHVVLVSPRKGRWIEMIKFGFLPTTIVSPRKGRWIEIVQKVVMSEVDRFSP